MSDTARLRASAVGSLPLAPGADPATAYAEAVRTVLGELPDLPALPELPGRGAWAGMTGRTLGLVTDLDADLQPAGWRLTGGSGGAGLDHRRARSLLAQDLDALEEQAQGFTGTLKAQVTGPWTLAATVERPRGDRVLADRGARRELAEALAEGVRAHVGDLRRRVPGAQVWLQVDEPALPQVMSGAVPTASGFSRHRSVDAPAASPALEWVLGAAREAGAVPVVHCCAAAPPVDLLLGAGAEGVSLDLDTFTAATYDACGRLLEDGRTLLLGVVPSTDPAVVPGDDVVTERVLRFLDVLGLDPGSAGTLVVTPTCGLAGASTAWALAAMRLCARVAANLG